MTKDKIAEKFEFFFIGLIFTVLGASIQTADFSDSAIIIVISEIISWGCFLISGLVGINKLEWLPNLIYARDQMQYRENILNELKKMSQTSSNILVIETGEHVPIKDLIEQSKSVKEEYKNTLDDLGDKHGFKNRIQRWSFYAGFVLIALSRATDHILKII